MDNSASSPSSPPPAGGEPASSEPAKKALRTFAEFLESPPPDVAEAVSDLTFFSIPMNSLYVGRPELHLHCEVCNGVRIFHTESTPRVSDGLQYATVTYKCRNCCQTAKTFSLVLRNEKQSGVVQKLGEFPPFGPPTPSRLFELVGEEDRGLYLKGRRAEMRGLGIGAFAYYRRIVEHQKGRIIEEIGKVALKLKPSKATEELFARAEAETQFSKAIEMIKAAIPESLLIDGHNPLTLLHNPLSEGLHEHTDEECLELATSIRVVLTELAERISTALKEEAELKSAVGRLLNRKSD